EDGDAPAGGREPRPERRGAAMAAVDEPDAVGAGTRALKSKMPCRPGLTPVTSDVQAGNVAGGTVERSRPHAPRFISAASTGSRPSSAHGRTRSRLAPSSPMTRSGAGTGQFT